jgi:hypothetical protein
MKLRSVATEYEYTAYLTTEHACSSYGQPVCREGVLAHFTTKKGAACTHGDICSRLAKIKPI